MNNPNPLPAKVADRGKLDGDADLDSPPLSTGKKSRERQGETSQRRPGKRPAGISTQASFLLVSVLSTLWFLIRVIPKPSRATYPCMQAAAPFMSGLIVYVLGLGATTLALQRVKTLFVASRYYTAVLFAMVAGMAAIMTVTYENRPCAEIEDRCFHLQYAAEGLCGR